MNTESMFNGMRRGKPDRWERVLERYHGDEDDWRAMLIPAERVLKLLRREHQAVVRIIGKDIQIYLDNARENAKDGMDPFEWDMKVEACAEILTRLKARAQ